MSACYYEHGYAMNESIRRLNPPGSGVVDIWLTKLSDVTHELRAEYKDLLQPSELARLQQFLVPGARDQFLVSRALLRTVLSYYAGLPGRAWTFSCNAYGKPRISAPECVLDLRFNISHTHGLVTCAVSIGHEIGIDVEHVQRNINYHMLASTVLAPAEIHALNARTPNEQSRYFYILWTLKEAYIKALGVGVTLPLNEFWFDLEGAGPQVRLTTPCSDEPERWQFARFDPTPEHALALAVIGMPAQSLRTNIRWIIPSTMMQKFDDMG